MAWLYVVGAALMEIGLFTLLKAHGFMRSWHSAVIIALALSILFILQFALKGIPLGAAYATFVGMAIVGTTLTGILIFHEPVSVMRLVFIGVIATGVIGLLMLDKQVG